MPFSAIGRTAILRVIIGGEDVWPVKVNDPFYLSLHIADPGQTGNQSTNEAKYTGYQRIGVLRTPDSWDFRSGAARNVNQLSFPKAQSEEKITHIGLGSSDDPESVLLGLQKMKEPLLLSPGIIPTFFGGELGIALIDV